MVEYHASFLCPLFEVSVQSFSVCVYHLFMSCQPTAMLWTLLKPDEEAFLIGERRSSNIQFLLSLNCETTSWLSSSHAFVILLWLQQASSCHKSNLLLPCAWVLMSSTLHNCTVNKFAFLGQIGAGDTSAILNGLNAGQGEQIHWLFKNTRTKDNLIDDLAFSLRWGLGQRKSQTWLQPLPLQDRDFADEQEMPKSQEKHTSELTLAFGR